MMFVKWGYVMLKKEIKNVVKNILGYPAFVQIKEIERRRIYPNYYGMLQKNRAFKNMHRGERCFILGNGPSLKELDFSLLEHEITFTVNQLARNPEFPKLKTNYHMWVDGAFFRLQPDRSEDMELLQVMRSVNSGDNHPTIFYPLKAKDMIDRFDLASEIKINYFDSVDFNTNKALKSNLDFCHAVPNFCTVVQYAIGLAVYMGFKEIYLLGCDCTGFISIAETKLRTVKQSEYGYEISTNEKRRMERISDERPLHLELIWQARIMEDYKLLADYCTRQGTKLLNATSGGLLETIPRASLVNILKQPIEHE